MIHLATLCFSRLVVKQWTIVLCCVHFAAKRKNKRKINKLDVKTYRYQNTSWSVECPGQLVYIIMGKKMLRFSIYVHDRYSSNSVLIILILSRQILISLRDKMKICEDSTEAQKNIITFETE